MSLFLIFLESSRRSDIFDGEVWAQMRLNHYPRNPRTLPQTPEPTPELPRTVNYPSGEKCGEWGGHQAIPIEGTLSQSGRPYPKDSSKLTLDELHLEI